MDGYHREQITNFSCLRRAKGAIGLEPFETNSVVAKKVQPGASQVRSSIMPRLPELSLSATAGLMLPVAIPPSGLQELAQYAKIQHQAIADDSDSS
jgi:hypothetical protein